MLQELVHPPSFRSPSEASDPLVLRARWVPLAFSWVNFVIPGLGISSSYAVECLRSFLIAYPPAWPQIAPERLRRVTVSLMEPDFFITLVS